jgi:KaiC/GvpD/RAD55 family RecA-like ATPase
MVSLDQLLDVPLENMVLLSGPPGSGKSGFCEQVILKSVAVGKPIIYVTTECNSLKAEVALRDRGLGEIEAGFLHFVDAYSETVGLSVMDQTNMVTADSASLSSLGIAISKLQGRIGKNDVLLVFDSLTSPYLLSGPEVVRFMRLTLSRFISEGNSVLVCFDEGSGKVEDLVAMMSLSNGVIKMGIEEDKQLFDIVKHPELRPSRIKVIIEPERLGIVNRVYDPNMMRQYFQAFYGHDEAFWRKEVGDYVHLFWPNLVPWSGMLWDPKRFPTIFYEANRDDSPAGVRFAEKNEEFRNIMFSAYGGGSPLRAKLAFKLMPKSFSKVRDMKKLVTGLPRFFGPERSGILEYREDVSKIDEHYFRVYENFNCWGFDNVEATMASYFPPIIAGQCKALE